MIPLATFRGKLSLLPKLGQSRFVGVYVDSEILLEFLGRLASIDRGRECIENHHSKYNGEYHVTLIDSNEFQFCSALTVLELIGIEVEINVLGLGKAAKGGAICFFLVCESVELAALRGVMKLPPKDFHITLGFSDQDLHQVSKGRSSLIESR